MEGEGQAEAQSDGRRITSQCLALERSAASYPEFSVSSRYFTSNFPDELALFNFSVAGSLPFF